MSNDLSGEVLDLTVLSEEYRKEVVDYYYFLLEKYKKEKRENGVSKIIDFEDEILPKKVENFVPLESDKIYE